MSEVRSELRDFPFDVDPCSVPLNESPCCKAMSHVVQPGTATVAAAFQRSAKPDLARDLGEVVSSCPLGDARTTFRKKEGPDGRAGDNSFPLSSVVREDLTGGFMYRDKPRLTEFCPPKPCLSLTAVRKKYKKTASPESRTANSRKKRRSIQEKPPLGGRRTRSETRIRFVIVILQGTSFVIR